MEILPIKKFVLNFSKTNGMYDGWMEDMMKEFTKLHVEKALKSASDNVKINQMKNYSCAMENMVISDTSFSDDDYEYYVDKDSIINSYPLTNIE
jgi:hypothetical protein